MALTEETIEAIVERYEREIDRYRKLTEIVADDCRTLVAEHAVPATVQSRTKSADHLREKLRRHADEWDDPDAVFAGLKDFAGVRITTYVERDRERVVAMIDGRFAGPADGRPSIHVRDGVNSAFYRATHCQVALPADECVADHANLRGATCEIQVCSLLAHVWNEIQHDLEYKPTTGELSEPEHSHLEILGQITRTGDATIMGLLASTDSRLSSLEGTFHDQWDFVSRTGALLPAATSFNTHSGQLFRELLALGIDSPRRIEEELLSDASEADAVALVAELNAAFEANDDHLRLDPTSSDLLLVLLLARHAAEVRDREEDGPISRARRRTVLIADRFLQRAG